MREVLRKGKHALIKIEQTIRKPFEWRESQQLEIDGVNTVCLALGPYRNLTTLTAAIIALHPNCQVLNHGYERIFGDERLNFLLNYSEEKLDAFVKYAIYISGSGRRGYYGGSIVFSHAFDRSGMKDAYRARYGDTLIKEDVTCLFWKESLMISNFIRQHNVPLDQIFQQNPRLKFLLPVRNPLDCAVSNIKTGHVEVFENLSRESSLKDVVEGILNEFLWVLELKKKYPERFFYYFENGFDNDILTGMAAFFRVEPDEQWCQSVLANFNIKSSYKHESELVSYYNELVEKKFAAYPEFSRKLLEFTQGPSEH